MSLFKTWEKNKKPKEWSDWDDFRSWAIANRYKAEYGYKGEFSPQGCLKAMPDYKEPAPKVVAKAGFVEELEESLKEKEKSDVKKPSQKGTKGGSKKNST